MYFVPCVSEKQSLIKFGRVHVTIYLYKLDSRFLEECTADLGLCIHQYVSKMLWELNKLLIIKTRRACFFLPFELKAVLV